MSSAIARKVVTAFRQLGPAPNPLDQLTRREEEVLTLLAKGRRYKEIADELGISYDTVRTHIQNIYKKAQVRSRAEASRLLRKP